MSVLQRIKSDVLPTLVEKGSFGADKVRFVDFVHDEMMSAKASWQSSIYFGDIVTETKTGDLSSQSILIKTLPERLLECKTDSLEWDFWLQFQNEFLFYSEVIPLLAKCDSTGVVKKVFPKFFGGRVLNGGQPMDNFLIFENVQKLGFKLSDSKAFIDYNHIKLSIEWLGKFHALSFVCKKRFPKQLQDLCSKIAEAVWTEERVVKKCDEFYVVSGQRGILPLRNDPQYKDKLSNISDAIREADLSMAKLVVPVEPLAVICLGDFCRNNIFYKYDSGDNPSDVTFFDFGTFRYASPIIDLSFFLFMNSSPEVRAVHWDDMLRTYQSAVISNPDLDFREVPSLEDVTMDFQRRGLYGYIHASTFMPYMLHLEEGGVETDWGTLDVEDTIKWSISIGGEQGTKYVAEIVKHMIDKNFDFTFFKSIETKFKC